jgi:Rrf2 family protein
MAANTRFATGVNTLVILAADPLVLQTSEEIAKKLNTNPVVIRRVLSLLQQAGLIESQKGPSGGSRLAKPAKGIPLGEVYRALEPNPVFHTSSGNSGKGNAALVKLFAGAQQALEAELDATTLAQLAKKTAKLK